jgi:formate/nitrite transporter
MTVVVPPRSAAAPSLAPVAAPTPSELAAIAEDLGAAKAHYDTLTLFGLAVLGGAFVALGGLFYTIALSGADGHLAWGVGRLLGGFAFSLGLILVVVAGAQLFTSDCLMVMAWASGRLRVGEMLRAWSIVWCGNFVGALGTAGLVFLSGHWRFGNGAIADTALHVAAAKASLPLGEAFFLGILCNVLVCLAAWSAFGARSVTDKVAAVVFPVAAFVAAGFEHCVADMYFMPLGLMIAHGAPTDFLARLVGEGTLPAIPVDGFLANLIAVTLGNWVGGAVLVGAVYWLVYRRPGRPAA